MTESGTSDTLARWQTVSKQELLRAGRWLEVTREAVRLPTGRIVEDFYRVKMPRHIP